jgi:hypothetical protein
MNWTAGIIAIVIFWIPCMLLLAWLHRSNKRIDQEYREKLKEFEKRYGG